jgi:hypothetical protein
MHESFSGNDVKEAGLGVEVPEDVLEQGTKATLKYIQQDLPRASIPRARAQMREEGREGVLWSSNASEEEANTIFAEALENIWKDLSAWIKLHPASFGALNSKGEMAPMPPGEAFEYEFHTDIQKGFNKMEELLLGETVSPFVKKHCETAQRSSIDGGSISRLRQLLEEDSQYRRFEGDPHTAMMAGFGTASNIICGVLGSVPALLERHYGKEIPPDGFIKAANAGRDFVQVLATIRLDMLFDVTRRIRSRRPDNLGMQAYPGNLRLIERGAHLEMEFTKAALAGIGEAYLRKRLESMTRLGTGCPALFARGTDKGNNVIGELYDWYLSFVQAYHLPHPSVAEMRV